MDFLVLEIPSSFDYIGIGLGTIGLVIGGFGLATALIFRKRDESRRIEKEKDYLVKRERCGKLLIKAHNDPKTPQGYRTIQWLRLDTGMSDLEFYDFYNEFRELCLRDERSKDKQIIIKIKDEKLGEFEGKLAKKPNQK
ncbi:MAG: hypothetical protein ACE5DT_06485 [Nitrosopumilus sp.]